MIRLVRETGELPPEFAIDERTKLSELGVNSVSFIKVIVLAEGEFGIEFDDDELDYHEFDCIGDLVAAIGRKCGVET